MQVRVEITQSVSRRLVICLQFTKAYPSEILLLELKSKSLSENFLNNLVRVCEQFLRDNYRNEEQIIATINFLNNYLLKNPLCVIYNEIKQVHKFVENEKLDRDQIQLIIKQKASTIKFISRKNDFYYKLNVQIPEDYPLNQVQWLQFSSNLPCVMTNYIDGQAREIARKCVEPPVNNTVEFRSKPSFLETIRFLISITRQYLTQQCPICKESCLPENSDNIVTNQSDGKFIERLICGHLYHQDCLLEYISEPPFQGKFCCFLQCHKKLMHHRWGESILKAETRYAARESRKRELQDVIDFLK